MSGTKQSDVVLDALRQALSVQNRYDAKFHAVGIIHHSDAGFQYTSFQLRKLIEREGITKSLLAPSVMPTITGSWSPLSGCLQARRSDPPRMRTFATWQEVKRATDKWVNWYNTERLYGSIDYVPPIENEACYYHNHPETDTTETQTA